jgi:DeoR/GlpR family transcriptional regulator of sugar metabolism
MARLPEERKQQIVEYLTQHEFADVESLAVAVQASPATVRRDLQYLAEHALITRTRGGAAFVGHGVGHEPPYVARADQNLAEKRAIAQHASTLIHEGEVIALDVGSTTFELAKAIRNHRNLTVFTASLPIVQVLIQSEVSVILVGGTVRKKELSVAGPIAVQIVSQFHFDKFFLGTAGLEVNDGFTDFGMDDVEVKKAFLGCSKQIIALADHTKLGHVSFATTCSLQKVHRLITDDGADATQVNLLRQAGLEVLLAPRHSDSKAN